VPRIPVPAPFRCGPAGKLVLQVGVPFEQGHAVDAGLGSQGDDGEGAAGGDWLACEETPGGGAEPIWRRVRGVCGELDKQVRLL
jgi:hypothetical protein